LLRLSLKVILGCLRTILRYVTLSKSTRLFTYYLHRLSPFVSARRMSSLRLDVRHATTFVSLCQYFSLLLDGVCALQDRRRCPSTFKNMLFLGQEGHVLHARKACSRMVFVIVWFLVGYSVDDKLYCSPILSVLNSMGCNDFFTSLLTTLKSVWIGKLLVWWVFVKVVGGFSSHKGYFFLSQNSQI